MRALTQFAMVGDPKQTGLCGKCRTIDSCGAPSFLMVASVPWWRLAARSQSFWTVAVIRRWRCWRGRFGEVDGEKVAAYRDGRLHAVSGRCTHLGCLVAWNAAERTCDCPCHGSRYTLTAR